jgi:SAM-dependent methyltransferase
MTRQAASLKATGRHLVGRTLRAAPAPVQASLRRLGTSLVRGLPPPGPPAGPSPGPAASDVPLPPGVTLADLERSFRTWSVNGEPPGHLDAYLGESFLRFLHTYGLVRNESGRCLELGANPYFMTHLLDRYTDLELSFANYFGSNGESVETVSYVPVGGDKTVEDKRPTKLFNIEEDPFPYEDSTFEVVLFCEMIEHLLMNPLAPLGEIHRVLKPGGALVLTTPNVARLSNVLTLVAGDNVYDPYSGFGPYGRHNREYTRHELHRLLDFAGFGVESSFTADANVWNAGVWPHAGEIEPLVESRSQDLGQYIFVRARPARPPRKGLPSFLYRSWPDSAMVDFA